MCVLNVLHELYVYVSGCLIYMSQSHRFINNMVWCLSKHCLYVVDKHCSGREHMGLVSMTDDLYRVRSVNVKNV